MSVSLSSVWTTSGVRFLKILKRKASDEDTDVLDILENSPAESAGLVPYGDWIVGWSGGVLASEGDFYDLVEAVRSFVASLYWVFFLTLHLKHEDKPLRVYVYSFDFK